MTLKEIGAVRRHWKQEQSNVNVIYGCYINQLGEPISDFAQSVGLMGEEEREYYHDLLKKTLSGGQGKTLFDLSFPTADVAHGERHGLLMALLQSRCEDADARAALYRQIAAEVHLESNYVILLACNRFDVSRRRSDESEADSEAVFTHLLCALCPVKQARPGLGWHSEERVFHPSVGDWLITPPLWGFLFPAFDDYAANLYGALCYIRKEDESIAGLVNGVFGLDTPPSARRREAFAGMLEELEEQCSLEVVTTLSQRVRELSEEHRAEGREGDFTVSGDELRLMLDECGVSEARLDKFTHDFSEQFGDGEGVQPAVLLDTKQCQVSLNEVTVKASPAAAERIEMRMIDGVSYLLIPADGDVEVNGVSIALPRPAQAP